MTAKRRATLQERCLKRDPMWVTKTAFAKGHMTYHIRAEFDRLARAVRKIRKEVDPPGCIIDAGYKTALNDVLALITQAKR